MDRKQIYEEIKKYNLAPIIRKERGNYTNLPNYVLIDYINIIKKELASKNSTPSSSSNLDKAFVSLVSTLKNKRLLSEYDASKILNLL